MVEAVRQAPRGAFTTEKLLRCGFREHPFLPSADPRFLYLSKQHLAALDRIQDVINWREGLAVVEGPVGVGKTSIARRLHNIYDFQDGYRTVYIHTATYSTATEAARDIAGAFSLKVRRAQLDQLRDFENFLVDMRERNVNAVVIIDDAQKMSSSSLDTILNMLNFDVNAKLIQAILFGQPELHGIFADNQAVLSRVASWQKLSPLPIDDTSAMVEFRCQVAGRSDPLYTDSALFRLYEFSQGLPRTVIMISNEVLRILIEQSKLIADRREVEIATEIYRQRFEEDMQ
jgi:general secretion pathway protein A